MNPAMLVALFSCVSRGVAFWSVEWADILYRLARWVTRRHRHRYHCNHYYWPMSTVHPTQKSASRTNRDHHLNVERLAGISHDSHQFGKNSTWVPEEVPTKTIDKIKWKYAKQNFSKKIHKTIN